MICVLFLFLLCGCTEVVIEPTCDGGSEEIDPEFIYQTMLTFRTF